MVEASEHDASFEPLSPPPMSAPPSPPLNEAASSGHEADPLLPPSYQHSSTRAAAVPNIRYDDDEVGNSLNRSQLSQDVRTFFSSGDPSLLPNRRGLTNSYDTSLFGLALHEMLEKLRLANLIAAVASISLLATTWLWSTLTLKWDRLVLSGYLGILSAVLLLMEASSVWSLQSTRSTEFLHAFDRFIKVQCGFLRHPVGKSCFLLFLATLCGALGSRRGGGIAEWAIGVLYSGSSLCLYLLWCSDPAFRGNFAGDDDTPLPEKPSEWSWAKWSEYANNFSRLSFSEQSSLIRSSTASR